MPGWMDPMVIIVKGSLGALTGADGVSRDAAQHSYAGVGICGTSRCGERRWTTPSGACSCAQHSDRPRSLGYRYG
jgi:hypothetical protein